MIEDIKIGDSLFYTPRYYRDNRKQEAKIVSETSKSWIVDDSNRNNKVIKSNLKRTVSGFGYDQFYTKPGLIELEKRNDLTHKIQQKLNIGWKSKSIPVLEKLLSVLEEK